MGVDVGLENVHKNSLYNCANNLRNIQSQLNTYKSSISQNWNGDEVQYIITAIEQAISKSEYIANKIEALGSDMVNTAYIIKEEENSGIL